MFGLFFFKAVAKQPTSIWYPFSTTILQVSVLPVVSNGDDYTFTPAVPIHLIHKFPFSLPTVIPHPIHLRFPLANPRPPSYQTRYPSNPHFPLFLCTRTGAGSSRKFDLGTKPESSGCSRRST